MDMLTLSNAKQT